MLPCAVIFVRPHSHCIHMAQGVTFAGLQPCKCVHAHVCKPDTKPDTNVPNEMHLSSVHQDASHVIDHFQVGVRGSKEVASV